ncbi:LOW QUALITY PROTEIN: chitin deacetylase 1-like [Daphnia carinata]|uniref:LOW QUALITY PROTEIN: chitin deacetylase 1-like n=1 Tax=Daphnia carinata TaxID=120202 RepID=UPI00257C8514|nr:LOW QUALITY PROTEIN: chitin deacetylase 1-like [Daphnia carinata]
MKVFMLVSLVLIWTNFGACEIKRKRRQSEDYVCPGSSGNYADPKSCRRFYQCVEGHPFLSRCPSSLYFDDIQKLCTFKNEAVCGPVATTPAPLIVEEVDRARKCDPANCELPNCFCSSDGTQVPGGLNPKEIPQMVLISMSDTVNSNNYVDFHKVFEKRLNPNGCPIFGTFFVAHEFSNYQNIQQLHHEGHEIATYSISHRKNFDTLGYDEWVQEQIGMREILQNFANISKHDIFGMRSPHLKPGYNTQYEVLVDYGYVWDSSASVPPLKLPVWPYTLDYAIPHECRSGTCPTRSFPGIWEFPLNSHYISSFDGGYCPFMDQCVLHNLDENDIVIWLKEDFLRYYDGNRAPYLMAFHTSWFQHKTLVRGLHLFIDWLVETPDVWFVTHTQALFWITEPKTIKQMGSVYQPWDCKERLVPPPPCNLATSCPLSFKGENVTEIRYMASCSPCPKVYPWLGDAKGAGLPQKDVYKSDNPSL